MSLHGHGYCNLSTTFANSIPTYRQMKWYLYKQYALFMKPHRVIIYDLNESIGPSVTTSGIRTHVVQSHFLLHCENIIRFDNIFFSILPTNHPDHYETHREIAPKTRLTSARRLCAWKNTASRCPHLAQGCSSRGSVGSCTTSDTMFVSSLQLKSVLICIE